MGKSSIVAVVLAGGQGTRIRHLLPDLPKPMAPVFGRPFLDWILLYLARQGIGQAIVATGYKSGVIEAHLAAYPVPGVAVACVREPEPLGTAGGFLYAVAQSRWPADAWLVLNGDSLVFAPLAPLLDCLEDPQVDGALLGVEMADAGRYGTLVAGPGGELLGFREKQPGVGLINAGVYLLRDELARSLPAERPLSFETRVFPELLARNARLRVTPVRGAFLDIGTPASLAEAEDFIARNQAWLSPPESPHAGAASR